MTQHERRASSGTRRLALTMGDVAGIGPEIVARLLAEGGIRVPLLVIGDRGALVRAAGVVADGIVLPPQVQDPTEGAADVVLYDPEPALDPLPAWGRIDEHAGRTSHAWLRAAVELAQAGVVDGVVTGPIHKEAWRRAGIDFPGHTEALAAYAGVERVLMLLVGARLRVALATIHVALADVPGLVTRSGLEASLRLLHAEIGRWFGPQRPRIAVCGLNPHAGEGGLFGREDLDVIEPAVRRVREQGVSAHGPLPADACIPAAAGGAWDAVLAMYHDQALPAVKTLAHRQAVNVTLGLPFPRTSVDHGTAFDVAGTGRATASSLRAALDLAADMVAFRTCAKELNDEA